MACQRDAEGNHALVRSGSGQEFRSQGWPAETAPKAAPERHLRCTRSGGSPAAGCSAVVVALRGRQSARTPPQRTEAANRPARRYGWAFAARGQLGLFCGYGGRACWLKGAADMVAALRSRRVRVPPLPRRAPTRRSVVPRCQLLSSAAPHPCRHARRGAPRRRGGQAGSGGCPHALVQPD